MPQPSHLELAKTAYSAYGEMTGHLNYRGEPMPDWDDLGAIIQTAWVAAATAVVRAVRTPPQPTQE